MFNSCLVNIWGLTPMQALWPGLKQDLLILLILLILLVYIAGTELRGVHEAGTCHTTPRGKSILDMTKLSHKGKKLTEFYFWELTGSSLLVWGSSSHYHPTSS